MTTKRVHTISKAITLTLFITAVTGCEYGKKIEKLEEKTTALENKVEKLETQYQKIKTKYNERKKANSEKVQNMLR